MSNKTNAFKTVEQLTKQLVIKDHLKIVDTDSAKKELMTKNYFDVIDGFRFLFPVDSGQLDGYSFDDFIRLYNLNKNLGLCVSKILGEFEIKLKSLTAYHFNEWVYRNQGEKAVSLAYINPSNFIGIPDKKNDLYGIRKSFTLLHNKKKVIKKYKSKVNLNSENAIKVYKNEYMAAMVSSRPIFQTYEAPPLWVTVNVFDFGYLAKFVTLCKKPVMSKIKREMGFNDYNRTEFLVALLCMKNLRNHLAHVQLLLHFKNTTRYSFEKHVKVGQAYVQSEAMTVFQVLKLVGRSVSLAPLKEVFNDVKVNFAQDKNVVLQQQLLQSLGNPDWNKWMLLLDAKPD